MAKAPQSVLDALHGAVTKALLERIKAGTATAADMACAIKLLKDNGINAAIDPGTPLGDLAGSLPFTDSDDTRH